MKIVLIGTGNLAWVLSARLSAAGHTILQVFGRKAAAAASLAGLTGAAACSDWNAIIQDADIYILAVADKALTGDTIPLRLNRQLVVHTAGAVPRDVLKGISAAYGVLYPLQSLRRETLPATDIPWLVDASTSEAFEQLAALAADLSSTVLRADDLQRLQYHLCAVLTGNFSNYLYVLAHAYCRQHALDFKLLLPLADETARRLHLYEPREVQTGPALRKDLATIDQHIALLQDAPALQEIYTTLSGSMLAYPW